MPKSSGIVVRSKIATQPWVICPEQSRAARGWLGWSQHELANQANVALRSLASFERGEIMLRRNNVAAIQRAIEGAGLQLLFDEVGKPAGIARLNSASEFGKLTTKPPSVTQGTH
jgi:transcriptional regulator with XRE-family HTH domain